MPRAKRDYSPIPGFPRREQFKSMAEIAALGCNDELIQSVTGHQTRAMVAKYAGPARQKTRAKEAQQKRN